MGEQNDSGGFLRHPLTLTVVGFVLTGVLGAYVSHYLRGAQVERDRRVEATERRKATVAEFSRLVYERRTRSELLASALLRDAELDELVKRKEFYDDAYVKWGTNLQANLFAIREVVGTSEYSVLESDVEFRLVDTFRDIDACLTAAFDLRLRGQDPEARLAGCDIGGLLLRSLNCGYAITDQLYRLSAMELPDADSMSIRAWHANEDVIRGCGQTGS